MGVKRSLLLALATGIAAVVFAIPAADAAPCAGFTDVDDADGFCPNVQWLKNRNITLGCATSSYCPGDPVTRLAMAAFLNRMSVALTPAYIIAGDIAFGDLSDQVVRTCVTGDHVAADFPRIAVADGSVTVFDSQTDQVVGAAVTYSTDGGQNWAFPLGVSGSVRASNTPGHDRATISLRTYPISLAAGVPYRFSIVVSAVRNPGFAFVLCGLRVRVENENGVSPPHDGALAPLP